MTTGWISRFQIAARTHRRIVLYGNVLDHVLEASHPRPLVLWLRERLRELGFERILDYDHVHLPETLEGEALAEIELLSEMQRQEYAENPALALDLIGRALTEPGPRTAAIIRNAELALPHPSRSTAILHSLGRSGRGTEEQRSLEIHLYTRDSTIPWTFVRADPDTELILVPPPRFGERKSYFDSLPTDSGLRAVRDHNAPITADHWARVTEGFRLRECEQLVGLSNSEADERELDKLLSLFRFGRLHDYWAEKEINAIELYLRSQVLGQGQAIDQIVDNLYMAKHKVGQLVDNGSRAPAMALFFVGATGVGKTMTARAICEAVTGSAENLKIFDMGEYQQGHSDQRLIGAPPGFVGFAEGGQLTNWVQERPHSVVLIDEVEKAHARILDVFLQILDGARLTDGKGATVDFSETILIFTSNIGATNARELDAEEPDAVARYFDEQVREYFHRELKRPELLNRLKKGGIIVFNFIDEKTARSSIERKLRFVAAAVQEKLDAGGLGAQIRFDPESPREREVVDRLLELSNYRDYGLREVDNQIRKRAGAAVGRFLDAPQPGTYRFEWREDVGKIALTPV